MSLSPFGLPENYTGNSMYQYYMLMLLNAQRQQQAQQEQLFSYYQAQQQAQQEALALQRAEQQQAAQAAATTPQAAAGVQTTAQSGAVQTEGAQQTASQQQVSAQAVNSNVKDGLDDGYISGKEKCKNFFKGVGNFFKGLVCDENGNFSWKRTLTTVAVTAGAVALTVATGGAATPFLVAAGAAMGVVQVGKGAYKAATAKTDAEAAAAWQEIGSGTTAVVGSVAGAKGALKSAGVPVPKGNAVTSSLRATGECFKIAGKGTWNGVKGLAHPFQSARAVKGYWNDTVKPNWRASFKSTNAKHNTKEYYDSKFNDQIENLTNREIELNKELISLKKNPTQNADKITSIENEIKALDSSRNQLIKYRDTISENVTPLNNEAKIAKLDAEIEKLKFIKQQTLPEADIKAIDSELALKISQRQKLMKQQTTDGIRNLEQTALEKDIYNTKIAKDVTTGSTSDVYKQQLQYKETLLKELKDLTNVEKITNRANILKQRLSNLEQKLTETKNDIKNVNESTTMTASEKAKALADLEIRETKLNNLIKAHKNEIAKAKRSLHNQNVKLAVNKYGRIIAHPSAAIATGQIQSAGLSIDDATAQALGFESAAQMEEYAKMNGFANAAQMLQYVQAQQAAAAQQEAEQSTAAQTAGQTSAAQASQYTTSPYGAYNPSLFAQMPAGTNLGFNDLYVSPYPDMIF